MGNIKMLAPLAAALILLFYFVNSPLYVSISFDVERDPPAINNGQVTFDGVSKVPEILDVLEKHGVRGTFFLTGRVAGKFPETAAMIEGRGHEVGVHGGFFHDEPLAGLTMEEQMEKISGTKERIENATGSRAVGYRAPGHLIGKNTLPALEKLGFEYDSSVVPSIGGWALYGHGPLSPDAPYRPDRTNPFLHGRMDILEIPITPVFINGNLDSLLAYQGRVITGFELLISAAKCKIKREPMVLYLHPGLMVDLPNEPQNYRSGERIVGQFDDTLCLLDILGARYVTLSEVKHLKTASWQNASAGPLL